MAVEVNVDGATTNIIFTYSGLSDKIQTLADQAAHGLWDKGAGEHSVEPEDPNDEPVELTWEDQDNAAKLDILNEYVKNGLLNEANSFKSNDDQRIAREAAEEDKLTL